jgi:hypothetical protein
MNVAPLFITGTRTRQQPGWKKRSSSATTSVAFLPLPRQPY